MRRRISQFLEPLTFGRQRRYTRPKRGWIPGIVEALETRKLFAAGPLVTSINRSSPTSQFTSASTVTYSVVFNETVTGVTASAFQVLESNGDLQATSPVVVTGSGNSYSVQINGIHGAGNLQLNLIDTDTISGTGGYLGGNSNYDGSFQGQFYTIDQAYPVVDSINFNSPNSSLTNATSVSYTVTFSESVTGVNPTDFSVVKTGTIGDTLVQVTGSGSSYTVTISGITGNGTLGLNLVDNNSITDANGNPLGMANGAVSYAAQTTYASSSLPDYVTVADINNDGKPDLIVTNANTNTVGILLGNGNGIFQGEVTYAAGTDPTSVVVADVNGDGIPDLVVAHASNGFVSILLGNNSGNGIGNGTFGAFTSFSVGSKPTGLAVADLNGDGKADIVTANYTANSVTVFLGNGNGTFAAQTPITFASTVKPYSVAIADVNNDGKPDLVVGNFGVNTVTVLLGNGSGGFPTSTTYASASAASQPFVSVSDVNNDGNADIVVSYKGGNDVSVLLGNGCGNFGAATTYGTGNAPLAAIIADLNSDGKPDLAVANTNSNSLGVLLGNGCGNFATQSTFAANTAPYNVAVGDFNLDGRPDLVVPNRTSNSIGVFLANSNGNFTGQVYSIDHIDPIVDSINRVTSIGPLTNATSVSYTVTFSESVTGVNPTSFSVPTTGDIGYTLVQALNTANANIYTVVISGITGNGELGLNLADNNTIHDLAGNPLVQNGATASFGTQTTFAAGNLPYSLAVGYLAGNGVEDLVVANYSDNDVGVLLGNGNGTFGIQTTYAVGSPVSVALAALTSNGDLDIVVLDSSSQYVGVLLGNGNGTFQAQTTYSVGSNPRSVAIADVNGDGNPDIVVANAGGGDVSVLLATATARSRARLRTPRARGRSRPPWRSRT